MKMMDNRTEFPRPHTSEEKTVTTLGSSATKNARIPAKDNFRGCRHCDFTGALKKSGASQVVLVVKNLPANAGDTGDAGLIPGLGRSPGGGHGNIFMLKATRIYYKMKMQKLHDYFKD